MAHLKHYIAKENFPKIENVKFYNRYGKTYMVIAPAKKNIPSSWPKAAWEKFMAAHKFAKDILADPVKKAVYESDANGKCSVYEIALWEHLFSNH